MRQGRRARVPVAVTTAMFDFIRPGGLHTKEAALVVACDDGATCIYTHRDGWNELPPIPGTRAARRGRPPEEEQA